MWKKIFIKDHMSLHLILIRGNHQITPPHTHTSCNRDHHQGQLQWMILSSYTPEYPACTSQRSQLASEVVGNDPGTLPHHAGGTGYVKTYRTLMEALLLYSFHWIIFI